MSGPHRIRLQAEWQPVAGGGTWARSFGRPTGVGPDDRIWLVIEQPAACTVVLNGLALAAVAAGAAAWRHDVTAALRPRNELRLRCDAPGGIGTARGRAPLPEALGVVSLEIESAG